jgi:hypothetical protein
MNHKEIVDVLRTILKQNYFEFDQQFDPQPQH